MTKNILLLAAVLGFIAQSSVFAADPTPSPSMSPKATTHHHKHHKPRNLRLQQLPRPPKVYALR